MSSMITIDIFQIFVGTIPETPVYIRYTSPSYTKKLYPVYFVLRPSHRTPVEYRGVEPHF